MNDNHLRTIYGLKYNPFQPALPAEAIWPLPGAELFAKRIENMIHQGGFALITGEPGQGKSKTLHWLARKLAAIPDLTIGVIERPQSKTADFYREMGELFGVALSPANRYGGFKALRAKWQGHCQTTLHRPVLLIDEAQEVSPQCLTELRLLQSARFDSDSLLFTILCGDERLSERFRIPELLPLGSRIRTRLLLGPLDQEALENYLDFALIQAGNPQLMSPNLSQTLAAHAAGNLRVLNNMAAEILAAGAEKNLPKLDEALFSELFSPHNKNRRNNVKKKEGGG